MTDGSDKLRVAIIGCGNIAGGFDLAKCDDAPKLTHAGGFGDDDRFSLMACVDPIVERRAAFQARWGFPLSFETAKSLLGQTFDVVSICSPTKCHVAHLDVAIELKPALIFCEKPIAPTLAAARDAVQRCELAGIRLAVNYSRRWSKDVRQLQSDIAAGVWGRIRSISCLYNKGVFNNCAHLIDLLLFLFGEFDIAWAGLPVDDFWDDDPTIPAVLIMRSGVPVTINIGHAADYSLFEMQVVTERGLIAIEDGGLNWRKRDTRASDQFEGYKSLDRGAFANGTYAYVMQNAIENIYGGIMHGDVLMSDGRSALSSLSHCEDLKRMAARHALFDGD